MVLRSEQHLKMDKLAKAWENSLEYGELDEGDLDRIRDLAGDPRWEYLRPPIPPHIHNEYCDLDEEGNHKLPFIVDIWAGDTLDYIEFTEMLSKLVGEEPRLTTGDIIHIPLRQTIEESRRVDENSNTRTDTVVSSEDSRRRGSEGESQHESGTNQNQGEHPTS